MDDVAGHGESLPAKITQQCLELYALKGSQDISSSAQSPEGPQACTVRSASACVPV